MITSRYIIGALIFGLLVSLSISGIRQSNIRSDIRSDIENYDYAINRTNDSINGSKAQKKQKRKLRKHKIEI